MITQGSAHFPTTHLAFSMKIYFALGIFASSLPRRVVACTFLDQLALYTTASDLLHCFDMTSDQLAAIQDELAALDLDELAELSDDARVCLAIECTDGTESCVERVDCLNLVLFDLSKGLEESGYEPSDELLQTVGKFCDCYAILETIPHTCQDFVDSIAGFHVPIDQIVSEGDELCPNLDLVCDYVSHFDEQCISGVAQSEMADECAAYAAVLVPGFLAEDDDGAYRRCASEAASVTMFPDGLLAVGREACNGVVDASTWDSIEVFRVECDGAFDGVVGILWPSQAPVVAPTRAPNATPHPTMAPSTSDTVAVAVAFTLSTSVEPIGASVSALKGAVASTCGVPEASIRDFTVLSGEALPPLAAAAAAAATRALAAIDWAVTFHVSVSPAAVGYGDGQALAAAVGSSLGDPAFATAAAAAVGQPVETVAVTEVALETAAPSLRPTARPTHEPTPPPPPPTAAPSRHPTSQPTVQGASGGSDDGGGQATHGGGRKQSEIAAALTTTVVVPLLVVAFCAFGYYRKLEARAAALRLLELPSLGGERGLPGMDGVGGGQGQAAGGGADGGVELGATMRKGYGYVATTPACPAWPQLDIEGQDEAALARGRWLAQPVEEGSAAGGGLGLTGATRRPTLDGGPPSGGGECEEGKGSTAPSMWL